MSDVFTFYQTLRLNKDLSNVELSSSELHYAYNRGSDEVVFSVKIPYPLLKLWHEFVQEDQHSSKVNFVDLLEWSVPGNAFVFITDDEVRSKINENIRKIAGSVFQKYKTTKGRARKELDERNRIYHVREGEIKTVEQWREEIGSLRNEVVEWRKMYVDLEKAKEEIFNSLIQEILSKEKEIHDLKDANDELHSYISVLENKDKKEYKGNPVGSVKNKTRTLNCFLNKAKTALWFANSFGLDIEALLVKEQSSGAIQRLAFDSKKGRSYKDLTEEEKLKIEQVLFLLDKFCVCDKFYHEFSFLCDRLPKSYLIKQCRSNLNNLCHLVSLGQYSGSQVNSVADLLKEHIADFLKDARC